jgi:predicted GNAT family acetyltransferase
MTVMTQPPEVVDNAGENRFEASIDGEAAELLYRRRGDRLILVHTGVPDELGGHGLGGRLIGAAVAKAAAEGLTIVPLCPFARSWLKRNPAAVGSVTVDWSEPAG